DRDMKRNDRWISVAAAALSGFLGGIVANQCLSPRPAMAETKPAKTPNLLAAQKFIVVDSNGRLRAILGASQDGEMSLTLIGKDSASNADLTPQGLSFIDGKGKLRAKLDVPERGEASLSLLD